MHVTVQCLASGRFVCWHWHWHHPHLWCCQTLCWPHFVDLNTTTNDVLRKWSICWMYHTCHCTAFSIRKICFSAWALASALASATLIGLPNLVLTTFCTPEYYNKWIIVQMTDLLNLSYISLYSVQHQEDWFLGIGIVISHAYGVAEQYADNFAEFIIHVTVQCLASGR